MSLYQTLYYMSLVGGMAGLFSWVITSLVATTLGSYDKIWVSDLVASAILGGFIGGLTVAFSDRWSGIRVVPRWIVSGTGIGIAAGLIAGLIQIPITNSLAVQAPVITRLFAWMLAGSLIGLALGLRWISVNRTRVVHAFSGGLVGGAIGGVVFAVLGSRIPDLSQAVGFMAIGVGICFGVTLAPILLRDAIVQFVSSGDARAQNKLGRAHKEWELQQGDSYVIGSETQDFSQSRYRPDVQILIPDTAIAPRHATLFSKEGRFFIARHTSICGQAALARYKLRVRGQTVVAPQELRDSDDILIGRTAFRFVAKKER